MYTHSPDTHSHTERLYVYIAMYTEPFKIPDEPQPDGPRYRPWRGRTAARPRRGSVIPRPDKDAGGWRDSGNPRLSPRTGARSRGRKGCGRPTWRTRCPAGMPVRPASAPVCCYTPPAQKCRLSVTFFPLFFFFCFSFCVQIFIMVTSTIRFFRLRCARRLLCIIHA